VTIYLTGGFVWNANFDSYETARNCKSVVDFAIVKSSKERKIEIDN
jgi:hypothetical protein